MGSVWALLPVAISCAVGFGATMMRRCEVSASCGLACYDSGDVTMELSAQWSVLIMKLVVPWLILFLFIYCSWAVVWYMLTL